MLFSQRLPNLLGGVSQAPDALKQPNEFSGMDNCILDTLKGIKKRPGTNHVGILQAYSSALDNAFFYHINRSETERYVVVVVNGDLKVYNAITGAEQTVHFPDGKAYLAYTAANNWRATTVGDSTFMVNRSFTVARDPIYTSDEQTIEALVTVWQTGVSQYFSVTLDGHTVEVTTRSKVEEMQSPEMMTQHVVGALREKLTNISEINNLFNVVRYGSVLYVSKKDGSNFTIKTFDSFAGKGMSVVKGTVTSLEELPPAAPEGTIIKVAGQPASGKDDIWVKAEPLDEDDRQNGVLVVWRECCEPGIQTRLKASTMPHVLERNGFVIEKTYAASYGRWPYPFHKPVVSSDKSYGWAQDASGSAQDESKTRIVTDNGTGGRTNLTDDYPPAGRIKGTWSWAIDTTLVPVGHTSIVRVQLLDSVGSAVMIQDFEYEAGRTYPAESFEYEFSAANKMRAAITLYHDVGEAAGGPDYPQLALFGSNHDTPGFFADVYESSEIVVGGYARVYPEGTRVQIDLSGGIAIDFTITDDTTAADLATQIKDRFDELLLGGLTVTVSAATRFGELHKVIVSINGGPITSFTGSFSLNQSTTFWNPDMELSVDALVGMTLTNHTSGATGTVTSNSETAIVVSALSGGSRTTFEPGDEVTVSGTGSNTWTFRRVPWKARTVGTVELSPWPGFLSKQIQDVFFHRGRLGFVADNCITLTAHADLYRFFRKTVTAVLEDDPIDVKVASKDATKLESAVEWNSMLILSTTGGVQYSLIGSPVLSPQSASLEHISSYPSSDYMRPYRFAGSLLFAKEQGGYSHVREMFEGIYGRLETNLLTVKVPRYIPGDIVAMTGDVDLGFLACLVNDSSSRMNLYVWQFKHNQTGELLVSAWHKWSLGYTNRIFSIDIYAGRLYLLTRSWPTDPSGVFTGDGSLCLEYMDLNRVPVSGTQVKDRSGASGGEVSFSSPITLPKLYRRSAEGVAQTEGRTQIRWLKVDYQDTQALTVTVNPAGPATTKSTTLNNSGTTTLSSGVLKVPVLCENTQVDSLTIVPPNASDFTITGIEWEAFFHSRNQRV